MIEYNRGYRNDLILILMLTAEMITVNVNESVLNTSKQRVVCLRVIIHFEGGDVIYGNR